MGFDIMKVIEDGNAKQASDLIDIGFYGVDESMISSWKYAECTWVGFRHDDLFQTKPAWEIMELGCENHLGKIVGRTTLSFLPHNVLYCFALYEKGTGMRD